MEVSSMYGYTATCGRRRLTRSQYTVVSLRTLAASSPLPRQKSQANPNPTVNPRIASALQLRRRVAQRRAQALFHHRVVERHGQHLRDGQALLVRPRQQVRDVLGARAGPLGAQELAGGFVGI